MLLVVKVKESALSKVETSSKQEYQSRANEATRNKHVDS